MNWVFYSEEGGFFHSNMERINSTLHGINEKIDSESRTQR